jgi:eukaryotic-like serine/threonine-protein kinase
MPEWSVPGYTELRALGSGGFGEVMLARHDASGVLVAIKYLRHDLLADQEFAEMFRGEAAVLASLEDPNVVRLYEYVESPAGAAIVMELIDGVSLHEILAHQGSTTAEAALVVLQGSLMGLAAAHQRGVVHRDYKPANVLVNGDGVSKLTDFGLAVRAGDRPAPAGTLMYVAPEQIAGAPASPAGDVYSATATFYECLTGRPPFGGESAELLRQHRADPVPLDPVPGPLRPLVAAGMAKDPRRRPADAITFVTALQTVASGAYGQDWEERGRSHLGEAALLLAALWPVGAPPAAQGTTVHRISLRHIGPVKAALAIGVAATVVAAGTALAASNSRGHRLPSHPAAAVHPVSLQPTPSTPSPSSPSPISPSPSSTLPVSPTPVSPSPSSTLPVSPTPTSPTPTLTSAPPPAVPQITSAQTYTNGVFVYFSIHYADPGHDAEGFGFVGVKGSGWAEEQHPFSSPSFGIVGPGSIAYPFNLGCGTESQVSQSSVEAWIYDKAGVRSQPVVIQLVCTVGIGETDPRQRLGSRALEGARFRPTLTCTSSRVSQAYCGLVNKLTKCLANPA